jgi:hypothetical protein
VIILPVLIGQELPLGTGSNIASVYGNVGILVAINLKKWPNHSRNNSTRINHHGNVSYIAAAGEADQKDGRRPKLTSALIGFW